MRRFKYLLIHGLSMCMALFQEATPNPHAHCNQSIENDGGNDNYRQEQLPERQIPFVEIAKRKVFAGILVVAIGLVKTILQCSPGRVWPFNHEELHAILVIFVMLFARRLPMLQ